MEANAVYLGFSTLQMMENAGRAVAEVVMDRFDRNNRIMVVCGVTGNGGDGMVAARHLSSNGYSVEVILLGSSDAISLDNTLVNWKILQNMYFSLKTIQIKDSSEVTDIKADVIIDALIGTSMRGALRQPFLSAVESINKSSAFKVAVDVPTGMEADTGEVHSLAVDADISVTFHKPKIGYRFEPKSAGKIITSDIGIPREAEIFAGPGDVGLVHPSRIPESYKGMFGKLLVIGGSETYSGAPALAAMGAYATGVDLVYVAIPETAAEAVAGFSPSLITLKLKGKKLSSKNIDQIKPLLSNVDAVVLGPGLGINEGTVKAINDLIEMSNGLEKPLVVDADGLKAFAENKIKLNVPTVFTPHKKEFEILTNKKVKGDLFERGTLVQNEAKKLGVVILLKGSVDIVSDGIHTRYNRTGNPGMTVGGTGDVLAGLTGGFIAMGSHPMLAAVAGAWINGEAGDRVFMDKGYHILPEDIIDRVPYVIEDSLFSDIN